MRTPRPSLVVSGQIVVAARPDGLETAEAIGIADGMVVMTGSDREVRAAAAPGARLVEAGSLAIVPGLHDFHLHLIGMARARRTVDLEGARSIDELVAAIGSAAAVTPSDSWVRGDGWHTEILEPSQLGRLTSVLEGRPALLRSHDRHSAWASSSALQAAGISPDTADPPGGRFERDPAGRLNGLLRESAADLVVDSAPRLLGEPLNGALGEVAAELSGLGITGVTDAGDPTPANGHGRYTALGDSFANLSHAQTVFDGSLRVTINLPADGIAPAAGMGLRTGQPLSDGGAMRIGWAKMFADGALGSRTAALFDPYTCGERDDDHGILRIGPGELVDLVGRGRRAGIGLAIHAIGDRAVSEALDALDHGPGRTDDQPPDRIEHAQLVRPADRMRFATLGVTASLQPIHLPSDRKAAEECWAGRLEDAYAYRSMAATGALLAFGSDAPIETANPWHGIYAAVRRTAPGDASAPWTPEETLTSETALYAYTLGAALAAGRRDLGHLRPGAWADLAVLNIDLPTLLAADERLASVRSQLTFLGGREVRGA
jgi:predicted amidohydrolase YtcJ